MGRESRRRTVRRQARAVEEQIRLPLVEALVDVRAAAHEIVTVAGLAVIQAMLEEDRARLCGPKHARRPDRDAVRGGTVEGEITLGGRRIAIRRPRVRRVGGGEVPLPHYEHFSANDPLDERAVEQMLVGVSTRKYARSLEPLPEGMEQRGTSRSAVSRHFVARTRAELEAWQSRPLGELDIVALVLDAIGLGEHTLVVALGIDASGTKHPLGLREGTTENATLCREMLADLVARGVRADRAILVVIDGGKGLRSAVRQVFGELAVVQRCQVHKKRNVLDHLPESARPRVRAALSAAYNCPDFAKAKGRLEKLAAELDEKHPGAASSLREGLEETLSILRFGLSDTLRRSLASTNSIESMFDTVKDVARRVTRWPTGTMALRWALAGIQEAQKSFRRRAPAQRVGDARDAPAGGRAARPRPQARRQDGGAGGLASPAAGPAGLVAQDGGRRRHLVQQFARALLARPRH